MRATVKSLSPVVGSYVNRTKKGLGFCDYLESLQRSVTRWRLKGRVSLELKILKQRCGFLSYQIGCFVSK